MKTIQFNSLAQFKKSIKVGGLIHTVFHMERNGIDANGNRAFQDVDRGVRKISIVQTNSFAIKTIKTDGREVDSWMQFPKASLCKIVNDDTLQVFCESSLKAPGSHKLEFTFKLIAEC